MGRLAAAYIGLAAAKRLVTSGLEEVADYERLQKGFTTLTGSLEKATLVLAELQQYSLDTGYDFEKLGESAKSFVALGFSADQAVVAVKAVGDQVRALGGTDQQVTNLIHQLGIVEETGQLTTRTFRQFANQGIDAYKILADGAGTTKEAVEKAARDGSLNIKASLITLINGMGEAAHNAAGANLHTLGEFFDQLVAHAKYSLLQISTGLATAFDLKGILQSATNYLDYFTALVVDVGRRFSGLEPIYQSNKGGLADELAQDLQAAIPFFEHFWESLKYGFSVLWESVKSGFLALIEFLRQSVVGLLTFLSQTLSGGSKGSALGGFAGGALNSIGNLVGSDYLQAQGNAISSASKMLPGNSAIAALLGVDPQKLSEAGDQLATFAKQLDQPISNVSLKEYLKTLDEMTTQYDQINKDIEGGKYVPGSYGFTKRLQESVSAFMAERQKLQVAQGTQVNGLADQGTIFGLSETQKSSLNQFYNQLIDKQQQIKDLGLSPEDRQAELDYQKEYLRLQQAGFDLSNKDDERNKKAFEYLGLIKQIDTQLARMQELRQTADDIGKAFGSAFDDFITGAKNARAAFQDFIKSAEKSLLDLIVTRPLQNFLSNTVYGLFGSLGLGGGAIPTPSTPPALHTPNSALGNIFGPHGLQPFAMGGIVNGPTIFPFARGVGLMGERGPEAIMPLTRGRDGKLGVQSQGNKTQVFNVNISTPDADSFRRSGRQITTTLRKAAGG